MGAIDVTATTTIDAARHQVASYVVDNRNDPEWIGGISESHLVGDPPIGVGSHVRRVASFMGRRIEYVNEVTRLDPGSVLEMRSVKSPFPMEITYVFEDVARGRTRASVRVQGDPSALYRLAGPLLSRQVKKNVQADLERLKDIVEKAKAR
jgi:uncharacterized membrane protein